MLKKASRSAVVLLFLLSLLTWFQVQLLLAWELSIVTTQLGQFFALTTVLFLFALKPWTLFRPPFRPFDALFVAIGLVAFGTYLMPTILAMTDYPGTIDVARLFEPTESKTDFTRYKFQAANNTTPLNLDYYPPVGAHENAPWILVIHGGGWINGDSEQLPELNWHLAKQGYGVISIDYRLSPGWLWPAPKDDTMRALEFIRAHAAEWKLEPKRWAILGRSAGAQIAGVVAYSLHGDERPKGFVSFYGPSDLVFGYGVGYEDDILRSRMLLRGYLGGPPEDAKALYESASEMKAVTHDSCPTLLLHGERDILVWVRHSERLLTTLRENGVDVQYVPMRFGPHGFDFFFNGPEGQVATSAVDSFLARVLPVQN
jgi:acetyl esterase/lipase